MKNEFTRVIAAFGVVALMVQLTGICFAAADASKNVIRQTEYGMIERL